MDIERCIREFEDRFRREGTPEQAAQAKAYLKWDMKHYGVKLPALRLVTKAFKKEHPKLTREELWPLVDKLWGSPWFETSSMAIALLEAYARVLIPEDMERLKDMLNGCRSWAQVDWIAPHVAAVVVKKYPQALEALDDWARHPNFWVRRASMLTLLLEVRKTGQHFDRFAGYAQSMLHEKEFFIRKAIGWVLRDVSRKNPQLTIGFVEKHASALSGLSFREATRLLPPEISERLVLLRG